MPLGFMYMPLKIVDEVNTVIQLKINKKQMYIRSCHKIIAHCEHTWKLPESDKNFNTVQVYKSCQWHLLVQKETVTIHMKVKKCNQNFEMLKDGPEKNVIHLIFIWLHTVMVHRFEICN